jgi:hypothetical protein
MTGPAASSPSSASAEEAKARGATTASNFKIPEEFTPEDLAGLLLGRFDGDETTVATFLLQAVSGLPNASSFSEQLCKYASSAGGEEEDGAFRPRGEEGELGSRVGEEGATAVTTVSLTNPRGKFALQLYERGVKLIDARDNPIIIKAGTVRHVVVFSKSEDMIRAKHQQGGSWSGAAAGKKELPVTLFMLVVLKRGVGCLYKSKPLPQICCQLPAVTMTPADIMGGSGYLDEATPASAFVRAVCQQMGVDQAVWATQRSAFRSHSEEGTSTTTSGMPFVGCYHGVNDGVLFPLPEGLLFFKPPLFVPADSIHSLAVCGRNSSGGRYVDLSVVTADNDADESVEQHSTIEFTNIHKDEATGLNNYIQSLVDDRGDTSEPFGSATEIAQGNNNVNPAGPSPSSVESRRNGRPPARKAGIVARAACRRPPPLAAGNDSDDEDADYVAGTKSCDSDDNEEDGDETRDDSGEESEEAEVEVDEDATEEDEATEREHDDDGDDDEEAIPRKRRRDG